MKTEINKTINLDIGEYRTNVDTFSALFRHVATREGWSSQEIDIVIEEALRLNDYDHFFETLASYCEVKMRKPKPTEVERILKQLSLYTHYLATKEISKWDSYDYSNFSSLNRKAGVSKKVFAIFTSDVTNEDKYIVTTAPTFFFDTEEEAQEELVLICEERKLKLSDLRIHTLWKLPK
ncbi:hypothetical protein [Polaribacter sp. Hel1_85]|uniref:hypothetical protein n=1 Tax=Polaribacter sp. Hel1_85 TaxID=1250005 RepID=UPI00052CCBC3|nr:hypothetical protein [Polaribacter sp. Hel1_85]KGL59147.1 hypothetical protein PHEL85_3421 [Polaribacter sp. Hel1_85]